MSLEAHSPRTVCYCQFIMLSLEFPLTLAFLPRMGFPWFLPRVSFFNSFFICMAIMVYSTWDNVSNRKTLLVLLTDCQCVFNDIFYCHWNHESKFIMHLSEGFVQTEHDQRGASISLCVFIMGCSGLWRSLSQDFCPQRAHSLVKGADV